MRHEAMIDTPASGNHAPAGRPAPDISLPTSPDTYVSLKDYRGRPVVLVFYPADWSPVCTDQLSLYQLALSEFDQYNAQLLGISVDGVWCHMAFAKDRGYQFPLLADFHPKAHVAQAYGVYREQDGMSERALFVIDPEGTITWSYVSPINVNPGADGILSALESMQARVGR
jgi:peroxiredoxin